METRIAALARLSLRFYNYCGGHFLPAHFRSAGGDNISSKVRRLVRNRRGGGDLQRDAYHRRCPPSDRREDAVRGEWAERPPERRPMKALTGLRFFAALLVVVSHFPQIIPIDWFQVSLVRQGAAGVTIFFVLSGFVLTYNYADAFRTSTTGTLAFIRARIARIWPINIVSLVIATLLSLWWGTSSSAATWVVNLLMLQALVPTKAMVLSWNPPAWSVSCELIFYCSFPIFGWVLGRVRCASRLLQLGVAFFAIEVVLFCVVAVAVDQSLHQSGRSALEIWSTMDRIKLFPGLRIWEFLLGCLIGLVFLHARAGNDGWWRVLDRRHARDAMLAASALGLLALFVLPLAVDLPERGLLALLDDGRPILTVYPASRARRNGARLGPDDDQSAGRAALGVAPWRGQLLVLYASIQRPPDRHDDRRRGAAVSCARVVAVGRDDRCPGASFTGYRALDRVARPRVPPRRSPQIKLLERHCGRELFRRRPRPPKLTAAGELLGPRRTHR